MNLIDNNIKTKFKELNVYNNGGGTEFYKRTIINEIEGFFIENNLKFIIKTEDELCRNYRTNDDININKEVLRDYQIEIINNFLQNTQSLQEVATGSGKTDKPLCILAAAFHTHMLLTFLLSASASIWH